MAKIPIIDFSDFLHSDKNLKQSIVEKIYHACHQVGFMYLRNFGISSQVITQVFTASQSFFHQPLTTKQQLAWQDEISNCGYVGIERERLNPKDPGDLKEAFNISKADAESKNQIIIDSPFPNFYHDCTILANQVLQALAFGLELPAEFFTNRHNDQNHTLRLLHYPPLLTSPKPGQIRAGEHSDYGSITLLFQDEMGGLEVQTTSGEWIVAPVIPGTVIVNTGDLMQRWTNHRFCSTKHRVMIPNDEKVQQSRYSIAFFCHPNDDTEIACLETCLQGKLPLYPPILAGEYLLRRLQATY